MPPDDLARLVLDVAGRRGEIRICSQLLVSGGGSEGRRLVRRTEEPAEAFPHSDEANPDRVLLFRRLHAPFSSKISHVVL